MAELKVTDVTVVYEENKIIENVSLELHEGELVCLLGEFIFLLLCNVHLYS